MLHVFADSCIKHRRKFFALLSCAHAVMTHRSHFVDTFFLRPDMHICIQRPGCLLPRLSETTTAPCLATYHHLAFMLGNPSPPSLHACKHRRCLTSVLPSIQSLHTPPSWGMYDLVSVFAYMSAECVCHIAAVKPATNVFAC